MPSASRTQGRSSGGLSGRELIFTLSLLRPENKGKEVTPARSCGSVCLCLCACLSVCISLCVCVCVGLHVCLSVFACMYVSACLCRCICVSLGLCVCVYMHACVCVSVYYRHDCVCSTCVSLCVCVSACLRVYSGGEDCGRPETSGLSAGGCAGPAGQPSPHRCPQVPHPGQGLTPAWLGWMGQGGGRAAQVL